MAPTRAVTSVIFRAHEHASRKTRARDLVLTPVGAGPGRHALDLLQHALGPEHPDVARAALVLAYIYEQEGRLEAAADLDRRVIAALQKALGEQNWENDG